MAGLTPISFTTSQFMPESEDIARRQKLADALQMQSMEPGPSGNMVSGWYVSPSWTQSLAHALKGVQASAIRDQAQKDRMDLSQRQASERQDALARAMLAARGTPASSETIMDETANGGEGQMAQINAPAVKADPMRAMSILAGSQDPMLAQAGTGALVKGLGPQTPWASNIAHLDPGKYTPESIQAAISANDPWQLRPRVTPNAELNSQLGYDKLKQALYMWENISPAEKEKFRIEAAKQGKDAFDLYFKTGSFVQPYQPGPAVTGATPPAPGVGTPLPRVGGLPQPSPQAATQPVPQPAPQPAPASVPAPIYDDQAPSEAAAMEAINDNIRRGGRGGTIYLKQGAPGLPAAGPSLAPRPGVAPSPEQMQKIELERPQAERALSMANSFLDTALSSIGNLEKNRSGLSGITGPIAGRLPSVAKDSSNAQSDLDALKAQLSVQGLQAMRDMSKTGGAVGQVTEKEWPRLEAMLGALGQAQSTDQFLQRLRAVKAKLMEIKQISEKAYADTYGAPPQAPAGAPAVGLNESEQRELEELRRKLRGR